MQVVLHGTNLSALHQEANHLLDQALQKGQKLHHFQANKDTIADLRDQLGTQSMFGQARIWKVEGWEKLRSTKQKKEIAALLTDTNDHVLVTINKDLTPAQKKLFAKPWQVKQFKLPKVFFQFTEAIGVSPLSSVHQLLLDSLQQKNEWELHALLTRQFRLLLATATGAPVKAPPFAKPKLKQQASRLSTPKIIQSLHQLFKIELALKSGQAHLSWDQEIDRLLLNIYDK